MLSSTSWGVLLLAPLAACIPNPQATGPETSVHVNNMTTYGTGCPIGGGPIAQQTKEGRPIFAFTEWGVSLPSTEETETPGVALKWCSEEIDLGGGPVGMSVRIETVTISGFATLGSGTKLQLGVETKMGSVVGGKQTVLVGPEVLNGTAFEVALNTEPTTLWSDCVPASGDVPHLSIKVSAGLVGEKQADGSYSTGTLGGESKDLSKALRIRFTPVWQKCTSTGSLTPSA